MDSKNVAFLLTQIRTLSPYIEGYLLFFNVLRKLQINTAISESELFKTLDAEAALSFKNGSLNFG